uniref:Putative secreted protein n=1 Tax=Anopheles darlingi TaxID=43151 RepID=A0A2M4DEI0_ANODA
MGLFGMAWNSGNFCWRFALMDYIIMQTRASIVNCVLGLQIALMRKQSDASILKAGKCAVCRKLPYVLITRL